MATFQDFPTSVIAQRVRDLRAKRRMSAEALADAMRAVGVPFDKTVIANLETGRRRFVTVAELLALAFVLDVAPVHLLVPTDGTDHDVYPVTPTVNSAPTYVRAWIRGDAPIGPQDARTYFAEVPAEEWRPPAGQWTPENIAAQSDAVRRGKGRRDGERR